VTPELAAAMAADRGAVARKLWWRESDAILFTLPQYPVAAFFLSSSLPLLLHSKRIHSKQ
jgi:hypothetical protein